MTGGGSNGLSRGVWLAASSALAVQLAAGSRYGISGDELYYLACANHLAWGYVDHPPLSIALLAGWVALFGDSVASIRFPPALFGAATVLLTGLLARSFGGGRGAQTLAAVASAIAPVNLVVFGYASMNAIDTALWALAFVLVARLLEAPSLGRWLVLGAVLGCGLLNKWSVAWLGAGLAVGIIATGSRRLLKTSGPWLGAALAVAIVSPHLRWQVDNGWPTLEFIGAATAAKMVQVDAVDLLLQQTLVMHPLALPLWAGGLAWLLFARPAAAHRLFGFLFLTVAVILIAAGTSRPNYLALAQTPLLAGGGVAAETLARRYGRFRHLPGFAAATLAAFGVAAAPLAVPLLPIEALVAYQGALGLRAPQSEHRERGALDAHFSSMVGSEALVDQVAEAWHALAPEDRASGAIFTWDYSMAGAIDHFGPARGLPPAISGHNTYWHWGEEVAGAELLLVTGGAEQAVAARFGPVERVGTLRCGWCGPMRDGQPLWIARPKLPWRELWPMLKHYD